MDMSTRHSEFSSASVLRADPRRAFTISSGANTTTTPLVLSTVGASSQASAATVAPEIVCDDLREQLRQFTAQLDRYVVHCKAHMQTRQDSWQTELREQRQRVHQLEQEVADQLERHEQLTQALAKEQHEVQAMQAAVQQLEQRQLTEAEHNNQLNAAIEATERLVQQRQQCKYARLADQQRIMTIQRERNTLEQSCYETILGLRMRSVKVDTIEFVFHMIDAQQPERCFRFTLNVASNAYAVLSCEPPLSSMDALVQQLNEHRHFYAFLKQVRAAFARSVRGG